jgi:fructose-bisphosphate aldolase class II
MTASIRKHLAENPGDFDPRQYLKPAREALQAMVAHKMRNVLGSSNKL